MRCILKGLPFLVLVSSCILFACNSHTVGENSNTIAGDYLFQSDGDTIRMVLQQESDSVYGDLRYAFSGKDRNIGRINGILKDSLITGEYTFVSEGIPSTRQVVFKVTEQGLIEGYGAIEENDGKMVFSDTGSLSFDHGMVLEKR